MALLDFKTFLVLDYLPIADSLFFTVSPFPLYMCMLLNVTCVWIRSTLVVFSKFQFLLSFLSVMGKGERTAEQCSPCRAVFFQTDFLPWRSFGHPYLFSFEDPAVSREAGDGWGCGNEGSLRFNPSKFLHKSSCRLSLLSFNLVNNL